MLYFDYAATTPIHPNALEAFVQASTQFYGNTSSLHDYGTYAKELLEISREKFAHLIGVKKEGIIFTSGGTESNVLGIQTLLSSLPKEKNHIIVSQLEHASIYQYVEKLRKEGYEITYLEHLEDGRMNIQHLLQHITDRTGLVIIQHVNSETGIIQPIKLISAILKEQNIFLHVDCVQSLGKIQIPLTSDSISVSGHKVYGPKGVGACIFPSIHTLTPALPHITHEFGYRAGTVNTPSICAFVTAVEILLENQASELERITALRKEFISQLNNYHLSFKVIESKLHQLPHIIALTFERTQGQTVLLELNRLGIAISTGTACQIGQQEPSRVMLAIGKSIEEAHQLIRISFGTKTTLDEVTRLSDALNKILKTNMVQ